MNVPSDFTVQELGTEPWFPAAGCGKAHAELDLTVVSPPPPHWPAYAVHPTLRGMSRRRPARPVWGDSAVSICETHLAQFLFLSEETVKLPFVSHANASTATRRPSGSAPRSGMPVWSGPAILAGGLLLGLIITVAMSGFNWAFTACFALGVLAAVLVVNPRGLLITVLSIPVIFAVMVLLTGWLTAYKSSDTASLFSRTTLLTGAYPFVERFPTLLILVLAGALIAVMRLWLASRNASSTRESEAATRRATAEAERRNRVASTRARQRSGTLTVAELKARNQSETASTRRVRTGERDRDARRREQAAERAARERIEQGLPARDALEREQAERVARARARREARERELAEAQAAAEVQAAKTSASKEDAPVRPDPNRRAGDGTATFPAQSAPATDAPSDSPAASKRPARRASRLDEDLYGED